MKRTPAVALAVLAFLLTFGIGTAFVRLNNRTGQEIAARAAAQTGLTYSVAIERKLDQAFAAAFAFAMLAEANPDRRERLDALCVEVARLFPIVKAVAVAPEGTVTHACSPAVDGLALGTAVLTDPQFGSDATAARDAGAYRLSGPYRSGRSDVAVMGFFPLKDQAGHASGVVVVAVPVTDLLIATGLATLPSNGYDYRITGRRRGQPITLAQSTELDLSRPVEVPLRIAGEGWTVGVAASHGPKLTGLSVPPWAFSALAATAVALWVHSLIVRPEQLKKEVDRRTEKLLQAHREITTATLQRDRVEQKMLHEASHDSLTGLRNRAFLLSQLGRTLALGASDPRRAAALVLVGLDSFTMVNESRGRAVGDLVLTGVSRRMAAILRPGDLLTRLGGDEFAAILPAVGNRDGAGTVAQRLLAALNEPFVIEGADVFVNASAGVALVTASSTVPEDLLRDAGLALHKAKAAGGKRIEHFAEEMHAGVVRRMQIESDLRLAIERGELKPYFEPVISLDTGRIISFEALARWEHPTQGLISPGVFIPVAEASGLITQVDRAIWRLAAAQVRDLNRGKRAQRVSVSVNLSARHLMEPDIVSFAEEVLQTSRLSSSLFRIEITESMMMENSSVAIEVMKGLKKLGIRLLLDDFGTGYSSLSYLHELPVDVLKVDRSFIELLSGVDRHTEIVGTIIALGRQLELDVIAEGLSNNEQLCRLRDLGCPYAQGWLFSRPVPAPQIKTLVDASSTYTPWHREAVSAAAS